MTANHLKVGRNDPCPCGSGKKYKKCCLSLTKKPLQGDIFVHNIPPQAANLKQSLKEKFGSNITFLQSEAEVKMSEVILHLAEDLLAIARKKSELKKAISITCLAWNLSAMFDLVKRNNEIKNFLSNISDTQSQQDITDVINSIIEKKNHYYPHIDRIILGFELTGNKDDFQLNVMSTVTEEDLLH